MPLSKQAWASKRKVRNFRPKPDEVLVNLGE